MAKRLSLAKDTILIGRYTINKLLAINNYGAVYEARTKLGTPVAIKETFITEFNAANLEYEAKLLASLENEDIPRAFDYFVQDFHADKRSYLVMEFIDGQDLEELLVEKNSFEFETVLNWAEQILDAVEYLHSKGIFHCDIKPSNIKLSKKGRIKLIDLGIGFKTKYLTNQTIIASSGLKGATVNYSPLEQLLKADSNSLHILSINFRERAFEFLARDYDARCDIYSIAATIYHLLTGITPPNPLLRAMTIWSGYFDYPPFAHKIKLSVPFDVSNVLQKALAINPDDRFATIADFRNALKEAVNVYQMQKFFHEGADLNGNSALENDLRHQKELEEVRQKLDWEWSLRVEEERNKNAFNENMLDKIQAYKNLIEDEFYIEQLFEFERTIGSKSLDELAEFLNKRQGFLEDLTLWENGAERVFKCKNCRRFTLFDSGNSDVLPPASCYNCFTVFATETQPEKIFAVPSIPNYEILKTLYDNQMGARKFLALSTENGQESVIETFPNYGGQAAMRFNRGMNILETLSHTNIVRYIDHGIEDETIYFIREFFETADLSEFVKERGGKLPFVEVVAIMEQVLSGLEYVHSNGIVHRDIKENNILIDYRFEKFNAKLTNFNLAKNYNFDSDIGMDGDVFGTISYMPPEQIRDFKNIKPITDIYAAGMTAYTLLTGTHALDIGARAGIAETVKAIFEKPVVPITERVCEVPVKLASVIETALSKEAELRWQSAGEMREALLRAVD